MKNVEDIYPISPMQEVMLLHDQSATDSGVLFNQFCYEIKGPLDIDAFRQAWQGVVERHTALRSCFLWETLKQPLQVVRKKLELPFQVLDLSNLSAGEQFDEIKALLASDRAQGFAVSQPPLLRITIFKLDARSYQLVWSSHHLIVDRWCLSVLFDDLFSLYRGFRDKTPVYLDPAYSYRDYINWIQQQDYAEAEKYWREYLTGFSSASPLIRKDGGESEAIASTGGANQQLTVPADLTRELRALARSRGLTLSVLVQGAWALLLNHYTGRADVVFGLTMSGRPPGLTGVETMLGTFITNLPVRVLIDPNESLIDWLKRIQAAQYQRMPFEFVSLVDIHRWCELRAGEQLFNSLMVWQANVDLAPIEDLAIHPLAGVTDTAYAHTLSIAEDVNTLMFQSHLAEGCQLVNSHSELLPDLHKLLAIMTETTADRALQDYFDLQLTDHDLDDKSLRDNRPQHAFSPGFHQCGNDLNPGMRGREGADLDYLLEMLSQEWRRILEQVEIGLEDNFFDRGGNSLSATRLHAAIEVNIRQTVPLIALFREPTIARMARLLQSQDWPIKPGIIIPVRPYGARPPLFCIASPDVNTIGFASLGRYLNDDQPLFILQMPPDSDQLRRLMPAEISAVSADYIEAMRQIQPTGPYHLLGMCTGAQLSIEMAIQLVKSGCQVEFLGIINTWAHFTISKTYYFVRFFNRLGYYCRRATDLVRIPDLKSQIDIVRKVFRRRLDTMQTAIAPTGPEVELPASDDRDPWVFEFGWSHLARMTEKFSGRVVIFRLRRHSQQFWRIRDRSLGWGRFADQHEIVMLPGRDHFEILREPRIGVFAEKLKSSMIRSAPKPTVAD